ncbi:hypothetical protein FA13DRAFT_1351084 [Coprinellus micaceus]|uniref:Uncharacterized protein n=1 Tax=Coprinellus micaceus TaxID=71717 RepID=A0A4Y7TMU0_COPMI|nr:hypothetical protein FA13DRAFT_1351084 [Coprinellus micaceus]
MSRILGIITAARRLTSGPRPHTVLHALLLRSLAGFTRLFVTPQAPWVIRWRQRPSTTSIDGLFPSEVVHHCVVDVRLSLTATRNSIGQGNVMHNSELTVERLQADFKDCGGGHQRHAQLIVDHVYVFIPRSVPSHGRSKDFLELALGE